jgi:arylsulfatase A-like enzyme
VPDPRTSVDPPSRCAASRGLGRRLAALVLPALALAPASCAVPAPSRPNLVLVVWDTVRADRVGCYGASAPTTPRLDRLAAEGVRFARALSPAPWTPPAHASLFTGVLPRRHGLVVPRQPLPEDHPPLLAETLHAAGYETVGVSANPHVSPLTGLSAGFADFRVVAGTLDVVSRRGDIVVEAVTAWAAERRRRVAAGDRRPVFLFVNLMDAHLPLAPQSRWIDAVLPDGTDRATVDAVAGIDDFRAMGHTLGIRRLSPGELAGVRVLYDAGVRQCDDATERILALLEAEGILRDALVAVTSDHGEALGEHGRLDHRLSLYDNLLRIPLVLRRPGRWEGGRTLDHPVALQDLHGEFLGVAGVPVPPGCGLDGAPLDRPPPPDRDLPAEYSAPVTQIDAARQWFPGTAEGVFAPFRVAIAAARTPAGEARRLKFLRYDRREPDGRVVAEREELFDLAADPGEEQDLLSTGAADADARRWAERLRAGTPVPPAGTR